MTIVPTLRRLRQESCHKTQAVLISVESSVRPYLGKEKNLHGSLARLAEQHSTQLTRLPGFTGTLKQAAHPTSSPTVLALQ